MLKEISHFTAVISQSPIKTSHLSSVTRRNTLKTRQTAFSRQVSLFTSRFPSITKKLCKYISRTVFGVDQKKHALFEHVKYDYDVIDFGIEKINSNLPS